MSTATVESSELSPSVAKRAWARLIKQVYEVDLLGCPRCAGPMRIIAVRPSSRRSLHRAGRGYREAPHPPRTLAGPSAQPAGGVPVSGIPAAGRPRCVMWCHCRVAALVGHRPRRRCVPASSPGGPGSPLTSEDRAPDTPARPEPAAPVAREAAERRIGRGARISKFLSPSSTSPH